MDERLDIPSQVQEIIINRIESHEYLPGEMIPSERVLAEMYGVSRQVIRSAIDELVNSHYLIRMHGKGTFVKKPDYNKVAFGVLNESENASFTSLVRNFGIEISNKLLGTGIIHGYSYFADKLKLSLEDQIYGIHRIRQGNKEPLAIEYTYIPFDLFPDVDEYNFERISLYDYMASKSHLPIIFQETMMMIEAGEKLRGQLQLQDDNIVNYIELVGYDQNGTLVEYTESYSRPDKLEVRFVTNDNPE
jgi:GntR family transcriptional regulator